MLLEDLFELANTFMTEPALRSGEWTSHVDQHLLLNYILVARETWHEPAPLTREPALWQPRATRVDLSIVYNVFGPQTVKIGISGDNLGFCRKVVQVGFRGLKDSPCAPVYCKFVFDATQNKLVVSVPGIETDRLKNALTVSISTSFCEKVRFKLELIILKFSPSWFSVV